MMKLSSSVEMRCRRWWSTMTPTHREQSFFNEEREDLDSLFTSRQDVIHPSPSFPALQFLDTIRKGSNADRAGLKQNEYVLEVIQLPLISDRSSIPLDQINGMNVISTALEECVQLIKRAGDTLALKVVTAQLSPSSSNSISQSLPYRRIGKSLVFVLWEDGEWERERVMWYLVLSSKSSKKTFDPCRTDIQRRKEQQTISGIESTRVHEILQHFF